MEQGAVPAGTCPQCKAGQITSNFTCCGITLAICFFPLGLLCCWFMQEKKCNNCNATY